MSFPVGSKRASLPIYVLLCSLRPTTLRADLTSFATDMVYKTIRSGGIIRNIYNNGVGRTPFRFKDTTSSKRFHDAQLISFQILSPGDTIAALTKELNEDDRVLKYSFKKEIKQWEVNNLISLKDGAEEVERAQETEY